MRKPTAACQRANSKVLGLAVYKNIAEFNEIENSSPYNGEDGGRLIMKRCGRGGPAGSVKVNDAVTQPAGKSLTLGRREENSVR